MAQQNSNAYLRSTTSKGESNAALDVAKAHKLANEVTQSMQAQNNRYTSQSSSSKLEILEP